MCVKGGNERCGWSMPKKVHHPAAYLGDTGGDGGFEWVGTREVGEEGLKGEGVG
jgi:hypothetical protein